MDLRSLFRTTALAGVLFAGLAAPALAQTATASPETAAAVAPQPLSAEEMEILVARIALYPDELVSVVVAASLYPLQVVEAGRFLESRATRKDLQPKDTWDGSVISLLNYPEIVKMMSEDLDWTQTLGEAITYQEADVLGAIQQLREKAVAEGIIKTDDKVKVVKQEDNIVIQPASSEVIYVPQYEPEVLYVDSYEPVPVAYYPEPYDNYYYPGAAFFAGAVTGAIWAGVVDWDDGFWGGNWGGDDIDIDIDCNHCLNNNDFVGKVNMNDLDWKNVDRSKISFDKNQIANIDRSKVQNNIKRNDVNKIENRVGDINKTRPSTLPGNTRPVKDVRASTLEGLKKQPAGKTARPADAKARPAAGAGDKVGGKGKDVSRPVGKSKPAAKPDTRPRTPSPMGEPKGGAKAKKESQRGAKSMGGGIKTPSAGAPKPKHNIGGGGGGGGAKKRRIKR